MTPAARISACAAESRRPTCRGATACESFEHVKIDDSLQVGLPRERPSLAAMAAGILFSRAGPDPVGLRRPSRLNRAPEPDNCHTGASGE